MRDKFSSEIQASFREAGFSVRFDIGQAGGSQGENGRSDAVIIYGGNVVHIEMKYASAAYRFAQWEQEQRDAAKKVHSQGGVYLLCVTVGKKPDKRKKTNVNPRKTWLMPYAEMIEAEKFSLAYVSRASIPYVSKNIRGVNWGMDYFKERELLWNEEVGRIVIPQNIIDNLKKGKSS